MRTLEKRHRNWIAGLLLAAFATLPAFATTDDIRSDEPLAPERRHEEIGQMVTQFIQRSHYNHVAVNDNLSSRVLDRYIDSLDGNRMYLLASDVEYFEQYRDQLDDFVKSKPLDPVYDMFQVYRTRVRERYEYALVLLEEEPDFTIDESFQFDRSETPWAVTSDELDEIWRQRIKNDALRHALNDKPWAETREVLEKRYKRLLRRMEQVNSDDVFEGFMNAFAHTLDPHSSYLSPRNSEEYRIQMSLSYFGIGASLQTEDDYVQYRQHHSGRPGFDIDGTLQGRTTRSSGVAQGDDGDHRGC